jgi:hypothetical protein
VATQKEADNRKLIQQLSESIESLKKERLKDQVLINREKMKSNELLARLKKDAVICCVWATHDFLSHLSMVQLGAKEKKHRCIN